MSNKLIRRITLEGDERFFRDEQIKLAARQGVPERPRLNEYFSLIAGEEPLGVFALGRLTAENGLGKISRVSVLEGHERKGYGTQLVKHMEDFASAKGITKIKATTKTWAASELFKHCGYEEIAKIPLDFELNQREHFQGGPQFEVLFLKNLKNE